MKINLLFNVLCVLALLCLTPRVSFGDLIHHYRFDADASDSAGGSDGELMNGASIVTDHERGAVLDLDGIDDFVFLNSSNLPSGNTSTVSITIATWVRLRGTGGTPGINAGIYGEYDSSGVSARNMLGVLRTNGNVFYDQFRPSGGTIESPNSLADDRWHHIAYVQNEPGNLSRQLYVDGQIVASDNDVESYSGSNVDRFAIGARFGTSSSQGVFSTHIEGRIDDLRFYDSALSASQVSNVFLGIPEPSSAMFIASCLSFGFSRRRRRAS